MRGRPVDGGGHEYEVGPEQCLDDGQGDGRSLVDAQELCLRQHVAVSRLDILGGGEYYL